MRKVFLSALACVAFAGSSFASNEVVKDDNCMAITKETTNEQVEFNKPCKIEVRVRDRYGNPSTKFAGSLGSVSLSDCDGIRVRFEEDLRAEGYYFAEADVTLIWGEV